MASHKMIGKGRARIFFRVGDGQYSRVALAENPKDADRICKAIESTLDEIKRGRLAIPPGVDPGVFVYSGGVADRSPEDIEAERRAEALRRATLGEVFGLYADKGTRGSKQASSLATERVHRDHFLRDLGADMPIAEIDLKAIEGYVKARAEGERPVVRDTIVKELATLLVVWKWAFKRGHVAALPPWDMGSLELPKGDQKPTFQTWDQIVRRIRLENLDEERRAEAWESLYLDEGQVIEVVDWVAETAKHPFLPALFAFAAYTGARRSEMVRSERSDWDFDGNIVTIREKKADTSRQFTTRTVPMTGRLCRAMEDWFAVAPDSKWAIVNAHGRPMRPMVATWHFRKTVAGSRWEVLRGWHVFRHSLASNMASQGTDQRIISDILGHHTEEMARRYGHLLPGKKESALLRMFQ